MRLCKYALMLTILLLSPAAWAETISISGSTTVQKYMRLAAQAYQSLYPHISFTISGGGSTAGFAQQTDRRTQIGMMSRDLTAQEQQELSQSGIKQIAIAMDAVVPVVSGEIYDAGVHQISPQQLAGIYRGEIRNWHDIGGPDSPIIVVDKNTYHGTRAVFAHYILGSSEAPKPSVSIILDSDDDILRLLQSSDQAIAYVGIGYINRTVHGLGLNIDGKLITSSYTSIRNGHYPMSRKLYLLLDKQTPAYVQAFVQFILSARGQAIAERAGYLPIE